MSFDFLAILEQFFGFFQFFFQLFYISIYISWKNISLVLKQLEL